MKKERKTQLVTLAVLAAALAVVLARQSGWKPQVGNLAQGLTNGVDSPQEPQDVIYRMLDAAREGDGEAYVVCYSGQMKRMLQQSRQEMGLPEFSEYLTARNREIKGIAISEPVPVSEDEVRVRVEYVYADRNEAQQFYLERSAGEWTIARVDGAERVETLVPYGTPVYD